MALVGWLRSHAHVLILSGVIASPVASETLPPTRTHSTRFLKPGDWVHRPGEQVSIMEARAHPNPQTGKIGQCRS